MIVAIRMNNCDCYEQRQMTPQEFCFLLKQPPGWVAVKYLGCRTICFNISYKITSYVDIPYCEYVSKYQI